MGLENRIKSLESQVSDVSDLEVLNKLDIINLKNEIERLKMGWTGAPERAPAPEPKVIVKKVDRPPREKRETNVLVCKKCGAMLPVYAKYCGKCGERAK